ncbi:MAG: NAD-dependent epimerase/dehydratase family protein [Candidatus Baltobacteraceae bacterium]
MNCLLVIGGSGFIGAAALNAIDASAFEIHATYNDHEPTQALRGLATWHKLQLFDANAMQKLVARIRPSHLLHLAWYMRERDHLVVQENLDWVVAGLQLTAAFVRHGGKRAVYAGTYAEYGVAEGALDEKRPPAPESLYAVCKDALRRVLAGFAPASGLSYCWTRIFTVYGPGDAPYRVIPYAIDRLLSGREVLATEGRQIRDFIHVSDVGRALAQLLQSQLEGSVNVGSGEGYSVREMLQMISEEIGSDRLRLGAREQAPGETQHIVANVEKLRSAGWSPQHTLRSGLQDVVNAARLRMENRA